jgi:hypothetical protein
VLGSWYVPSYVAVNWGVSKPSCDTLSGKPPCGRVELFPLGCLAFPRVVWACLSLPEYLLDLPRVSLSLGPRESS